MDVTAQRQGREDQGRPALPTPGPDAQRGPLRDAWPYALVLGLAYVAPAAVAALLHPAESTDLRISALLLVNPLVTFVVAAAAGFRHGFAWALPPLAAVAWLPATFLAYNDTALPYVLLYALFSVTGLGFGAGLRAVLPGGRPTSR